MKMHRCVGTRARGTGQALRQVRTPPTWFALAGAASCCVAAGVAVADGIAPGEWKLTESIMMNGNATTGQQRTRCLSPEQASDPAATFTPEYGTNNSCKRVEFESTATSLFWHMQCSGQMEMDVVGSFAFDTPRHYSAKIVSRGTMGGQVVVNSQVAIEGERVGECK
jgi:Protein of unknown function (DUF3617)